MAEGWQGRRRARSDNGRSGHDTDRQRMRLPGQGCRMFRLSLSITTMTGQAQPLEMSAALRCGLLLRFAPMSLSISHSTRMAMYLILYTDAPAPMSLYDGRYDLFYGQQDWTWKGGPPAAAPGFGPIHAPSCRSASREPAPAYRLM